MHCKAVVSTSVSSFLGKGGSTFFRSHTHSFPLADCEDQIHYKNKNSMKQYMHSLQYIRHSVLRIRSIIINCKVTLFFLPERNLDE